jgi:heptosyltransferase-1
VREPFVSRFYDHRFEFAADQHRVWQYRGLAAKTFGYELDDVIDYGLVKPSRPKWIAASDYVVLLHSTARSEKLWSEASWVEVGHRLAARGIGCVLPWGNQEEEVRAERIAALIPNAQVAPQLRVDEAGAALAHARAVIGVDTGLMHLAVALEVPVVGIYCATRPLHHGPLGRGPTAFRGGMGDTPRSGDVLEALGEVAPDLV